MADGLSIAASVVGIAAAALQSIQFLATTIDNIKDVPDTIKNIKVDLDAVGPILRYLHTALQGDASQILLNDEIKFAIENCERACTAFRTSLDHWMRHSTENKTFWMDRWRVGLFGNERIKTFKGQLNDCKATISVALSTASVLTTTSQGYLMKELKDAMLQQNEVVLQREIARADSERMSIENDLQQLLVGSGIQKSEESELSKQALIEETRHRQASSDAFHEMCEQALSRVVFKRTGQKIKGVRATNHSTALAGFINTLGEELRIDQDISDVSADNWSIATAGVVKNVDFRTLRPSGF